MADFEIAHKRTEGFEGGYANDKDDSGGETWRGIARNYNPKWKGWVIIDKIVPVKPKTWNRAIFAAINKKLYAHKELNQWVDAYYEANYWDCINLDFISSQEVANSLFDISVNMGSGRAARFLQKALGVLVDGKIGPKTIAAANSSDPKFLYDSINELRAKKYEQIIADNPSQEKFRESWFSRIKPFEKALV